MTMPSSAELTRARVARRSVAILLVVVGLVACALSLLQVTGGVAGQIRLVITLAFLLLGPGGRRPGSCGARPRRTCGCSPSASGWRPRC